MFKFFGSDKKEQKIADTLSGIASIFRGEIQRFLFSNKYRGEVYILKSFSLPTGIISYHLKNYISSRQHDKIIDQVEQESFNFAFAMYLKDKLNQPNLIKQARADFRKDTNQMIDGIRNTFSKSLVEDSIIPMRRLLPDSSLPEIHAFGILMACVNNPSPANMESLVYEHKNFSREIEKFRANIEVYLRNLK